MEIVACHCLKCKATLGRFRNSWNGIGNTYFSPVHPPLSVIGFESTGDVYKAAQGSEIEDSLLQDLACAACQHVLGLRCDSAPDGHLLQQNQLILRLVEMSVISEGSGAKAKISLMKSYPLTSYSVRARNKSVSLRASTPRPPRLLPNISRMPAAISRQSTPAMIPPQVDVTTFKSWAESAINTQKQDIDRLSGSFDRIERDMQILRKFMDETRTELASNRHLQDNKTEEGLANVRGELDTLRKQVNSKPRPVSTESFELLNRSLDTVAQDIQLVSRKVDEVDELKRELEQLKARLNSFENAATSSLDETANNSLAVPQSTSAECPVHPPKKPHNNVRETRSRRKRNHDQFDEDELSSYGELLALPAKRIRSKNISVNKDSTVYAQNNSVGRGQKINTSSRMVIEIDSSNGPHQLTIHGQDEEAQFNLVEDEGDNFYLPPTIPISETTPSGVEGSREFTPLPGGTSLPLTERIMYLNKVIEPDYRILGKDVERGRKRASKGLLYTKDGKVDRRSLRFLRDQENQTPIRCSLAPETPENRSQHVVSQQLSDPFELPVLPSIERIESAPKPRSTPHPRSGPRSHLVTPGDQKPFKCGSCKKQYTSRAGLKYHHDHAKSGACREGEGDVCPEEFTCNICGGKFGDLQRLDRHRCHGELGIKITLEDRGRSLAYSEATVAAYEARLADRDRLVRQTLDREMSAVF